VQLTGNPVTDAAMDAALTGDMRQITWRTQFDWNNDGGFSNAWSDMSGALTSVDVDQEWTTTLPQNVAGITGYSTGTCTMVFEGTRTDDDQMTVFQLLSEYNSSSPLFQRIRIGIAVRVDCIVQTAVGAVAVRKFTGLIHYCTPSRSGLSVTITAWDRTSALHNVLTLPRWAIDGETRAAHASLATITDTTIPVNGWIPTTTDVQLNAAGVIDLILRANSVYVAPAPASGAIGKCLISVPLSGTHVPDLGFGWFDYSVDFNASLGVSVVPDEPPPWAPGQYGNAYLGDPSYVYLFNYQANSVFNPNSPPVGGVTLSMGMWVKPAGPFGNNSVFDFNLTPNNFDSTTLDLIELDISATGATSVLYLGESTLDFTVSGPTLVAGVWNYLGVATTFNSSSVQTTFFLNGVQASTTTHAGAFPTVVVPYAGGPYQGSQVLGLNNQLSTQIATSVQNLQVWTFAGLPVQAVNWPMTPPASTAHTIDLSLNTLQTIPDVYAQDPWDILKQIVSAELGVLFTDELGNWHFYNRVTLRGVVAQAPTQVITLDSLQELSITTAKDGVRNFFTWSATTSAQWIQSVWNSPTPGYLSIPPGPSFSFSLQNSDAAYISPEVHGLVTAVSPDATLDSTRDGWYAIETDAGNAQFNPTTGTPPVTNFNGMFWEVHSDPNGRFGSLQIQNVGTHTLQFCTKPSGAGVGSPSFLIGGYQIVSDTAVTGNVINQVSITNYGFQPYDLPGSPWLQTADSAIRIVSSLILDTHVPLPIAQQPITALGDPRRQLGDSFELQDPGRSGPRILCTGTGIRSSWTPTSGYLDSITVQPTAPPGGWILGDPDFSILGVTTTVI
jgi:hypothetical protein